MYKRHKLLLRSIFVVVFVCMMLLDADYSKVAESSISIMAIGIAVYIGATSVILGSTYAEKMKGQVDPEIKTRTSLGVLATYLRYAGTCSIVMIAISIIYVLEIEPPKFICVFLENAIWNVIGVLLIKIASAAFCGLFAVNIAFMYLILLFLINSMTKSVK